MSHTHPTLYDQLPQNRAFINGQWVEPCKKRAFSVYNPATAEPFMSVADCGAEDALLAIESASGALREWRAKTGKERSILLRQWFNLIMENQQSLAQLLTLEQGKPLAEALGEVAYGASFIEWFSEEAKRVDGELLASPKSGQKIMVSRQPVGVCLAVTPWNFPVAMITRKVAPALAAGCTVIVKPAEETPLSALALAQLSKQAGIPGGVLNIVTTTRPNAIVAVMQKHPAVRKISFTGSTETGKHLMRQASENLQRISLELGGNAPFIVLADADLDAAVAGAMASKFRNSGQTCVCTNRFLVHKAVYQEFSTKLVAAVKKLKMGDGLAAETTQGPLINEAAVNKVEEHIVDAITQGAKLLCGGQRRDEASTFFQPTVLGQVSRNMLINQEETFGPVAALIPFNSEDEAIDIANDTPYGLAAYVYTKDLAAAMRMSDQLESGMVAINDGILSNEVSPFGGIKQSGLGREGSKYGIEEYLDLKYTLISGL
ncbi:MAG: NAD-dependent succinate-semialdehyde dehydrogenase [Hahellaceae bacterium]|nr:NAD-dependent succinate-semialdehyde dehydrogenase [Hahellaceae bacterium]MCP5209745.1 NAD-dependent succinate-semialdehyde dehydrogenase [Hahellaceae bacterium]